MRFKVDERVADDQLCRHHPHEMKRNFAVRGAINFVMARRSDLEDRSGQRVACALILHVDSAGAKMERKSHRAKSQCVAQMVRICDNDIWRRARVIRVPYGVGRRKVNGINQGSARFVLRSAVEKRSALTDWIVSLPKAGKAGKFIMQEFVERNVTFIHHSQSSRHGHRLEPLALELLRFL